MLKSWLQKRFINWLVKDLFNTITADDILDFKPGGVYLRGRKLDQQTIMALQHDADGYSESTLVNLESAQIKYLANLRMYEKSQTIEDILASKMALWILEQQKIFRDKVRKLK